MMELRYKSTRSDADPMSGLSYKETAYEVMKLFLTDFTKEELQSCIDGAYDGTFDVDEIVPLVKKDGAYYLELFHGRTIAFKDMALSILPYLMTTAAKKNGVKNEIVILTATSGSRRKGKTRTASGARATLTTPRRGSRPCSIRRSSRRKWIRPGISSRRRIRSISEGSYRRSSIMCMRTDACSGRGRSRAGRRSM